MRATRISRRCGQRIAALRDAAAQHDVDGYFWGNVAFRDEELRVCGNAIFKEVLDSCCACAPTGCGIWSTSLLGPDATLLARITSDFARRIRSATGTPAAALNRSIVLGALRATRSRLAGRLIARPGHDARRRVARASQRVNECGGEKRRGLRNAGTAMDCSASRKDHLAFPYRLPSLRVFEGCGVWVASSITGHNTHLHLVSLFPLIFPFNLCVSNGRVCR